MKYFYAILFLSFSIIFIHAQPKTETTPKTSSESNNTSGSNANLSKIKREPLVIPKIASSPVIDGKVNDEIWKKAATIKDFIQIEPGDNIAPTKPTEAYLAYDEQNLYVAFKCWDEKDKIRASVVQRDGAFGEDNVRIWLDTYNDQRRAYVIGANPLGIQQDGIQTEGQGVDFNVDILMESKGVVEDWGWSVEMKIPFKSLRYTAGKGKLWGFNAARNIDRMNDELDSWVPLPRDLPGFVSKFGKLTGLDEIKAERTFEIIPTVTLKETGKRVSPTKFSNPPAQADFGFTAKYQITPNVTLDAAYNPDFADTEADAPVVEANQRFPIFFQEKRPFFLEGVDTFRTPIQAVYTRRVENPNFAVKLTGKVGRNSFGVFGAVDDPLNNPNKDKAYDAVVRLKRDFGKESNIGFLGTFYSFGKDRKNSAGRFTTRNVKNNVAGFDASWKSATGSQFRGQILASNSRNYFYNPSTDRRDFRTGNAVSYDYIFFHNKRNFTIGFGGRGATKDYRADLGFTNRTNTNQFFTFVELGSDPKPKAFIISRYLNASFGVRHDFQGRLQSYGFDSNINLNLRGNAGGGFGGSANKEILVEDEFGPKRALQQDPQGQRVQRGAFFGEPRRSANQASFFGYGYKNFNKRFSLNASGNLNFNNFDFDFGAGDKFDRVSPAAVRFGQNVALDPGTGREFSFDIGAEVKPTDKFNFQVGFNKDEFRRNDTKLITFISNIATFRSTYQFSRFVSVKARLDYSTINGRLRGQYTFAWTPSPGKALYVGYNDSANYNGYVFGSRRKEFQQLNRTFFIKLSYLFRKSF
jgi:Carbohydrate family 9 binding domain-like/Domain of unknown function (DUF5916)